MTGSLQSEWIPSLQFSFAGWRETKMVFSKHHPKSISLISHRTVLHLPMHAVVSVASVASVVSVVSVV